MVTFWICLSIVVVALAFWFFMSGVKKQTVEYEYSKKFKDKTIRIKTDRMIDPFEANAIFNEIYTSLKTADDTYSIDPFELTESEDVISIEVEAITSRERECDESQVITETKGIVDEAELKTEGQKAHERFTEKIAEARRKSSEEAERLREEREEYERKRLSQDTAAIAGVSESERAARQQVWDSFIESREQTIATREVETTSHNHQCHTPSPSSHNHDTSSYETSSSHSYDSSSYSSDSGSSDSGSSSSDSGSSSCE